MTEEHRFGFDTLAVHAGQRPDPLTGRGAAPSRDGRLCLRGNRPCRESSCLAAVRVAVFEERVAALEGGIGRWRRVGAGPPNSRDQRKSALAPARRDQPRSRQNRPQRRPPSRHGPLHRPHYQPPRNPSAVAGRQWTYGEVAGFARSDAHSSSSSGCGRSRSASTVHRKPNGSAPALSQRCGVSGAT